MRYFLLALTACGASLADVRPAIDQCRVIRIDYIRAGVFVVEAPEHRIKYGGDVGELEQAMRAAQPRCGGVPRLRE